MWDKSTRKVIFLYLYNYLFWNSLKPVSEENNLLISQDLSKVLELDSDLVKIPQDLITAQLELFKEKQLNFENKLKSSLSNWSQTYLIVKAVLFTFLLESDWVEINDTKPKSDLGSKKLSKKVELSPTDDNLEQDLDDQLLGRYLRLAQEYANSRSVAVVHAVLAKLTNVTTP